MLTIFLIVAARFQDTSVVEYYDYLFPRMRGGGAVATRSLPFGNFVLGAYLVASASIALNARRRIASALVRRRARRQRQIN